MFNNKHIVQHLIINIGRENGLFKFLFSFFMLTDRKLFYPDILGFPRKLEFQEQDPGKFVYGNMSNYNILDLVLSNDDKIVNNIGQE